MNSYERVFAHLEGKPVDQVPNFCLVMQLAADEIGVPYGRFVTDYRLFAQGMLYCYEKFNMDLLCACSDPMREADGFGAKVIIPEDAVPYCAQHRLEDISQVSTLKVCNPWDSPRMNDRVECVRLMKEQSCGQVPVVGWVEGSVAESCDLMDMSECLCTMMDEPEAMHDLLTICLEQGILFAKAQVEAGADIIGVGDAASSLLGPALYEEMALPYQQKLIAAIHKMGAKVKLHICGDLNPVLHLVQQSGADIYDLDHMVDMKKACETFPKDCIISGNFDPVQIMLQGSPETVAQAVKQRLEYGKLHKIAISAGCEVARGTPEENFKMVAKTIAQWS